MRKRGTVIKPPPEGQAEGGGKSYQTFSIVKKKRGDELVNPEKKKKRIETSAVGGDSGARSGFASEGENPFYEKSSPTVQNVSRGPPT